MKREFSDAVSDIESWGFEIADIYGIKDNETYSFSKQVGEEEAFINITHMHFKVSNVSVLVMPKARPPRIRMR
ncbi:MAG: hypothetical protein P8J32_07165 [bacterium]|nr:hypothetical protein [bacterium]